MIQSPLTILCVAPSWKAESGKPIWHQTICHFLLSASCFPPSLVLDYLIIGHVARDITPDGWTWGGTAYYSAIAAQRLGARVGVVTATAEANELRSVLPGIELHIIPTERTTTFENRYRGNQREQILHHAAPPLTQADIPAAWQKSALVHLAPIAQDVDKGLLDTFASSFLGITPQGWMRGWNEQGRVGYQPLPNIRTLFQPVDVLVFSAEDVGDDPIAMRDMIHAVPLAVVTQAAEGATVYTQDGAHPMPARASTVIDPTGAGDVFATAYFLRLYETGHPLESAAFANVVASFAIEAHGTAAIPTRAHVEAWLAEHRS
jgi:sugar/nucleoside kinase (ribokinase family)